MPAKKNARKRTRNNNDSSGPPKKRVKKVSKKNVSNVSVRRSSRSHQKPSEWWITSQSHNQNDSDDNDNDSDSSENTYLPPIRRSNAKINKNQNKNNKSSDKEEKEECHEESTQNTDSDDTNDSDQNSDHMNPINPIHDSNNTAFNLLSPHKKQNVDDLPQQINVIIASNENHQKIMKKLFSNIEGINDENDNNIHCIKNVLKESSLLKKSQFELTEKITKEYNDLSKIGEIERNELNKNISEINNKYVSSQKLLERNMEKVLHKIKEINDTNNEKEDNDTESKYKILYETSMKKIKLLNDDLINLQNELKSMKEDKCKNDRKSENVLIDVENNKNKEISDLKRKYLIEINDLKLELSCNLNEFNEYKQKINEKDIIFGNNNNLLIENLKRENNALSDELSMYRKNNDDNRTLTPNNNNSRDHRRDYSDYNNHILQSPLNERNKNQLISISNAKDLENKIKNLNQEIECFKLQLFAKKELIKEFQTSLQNNHMQQKDFLVRQANHNKIINLYEILTCTKIEANNDENNNRKIREEQYKCRTKNKETDSMLEYYLTLDEKEEKLSFCDYYLIGSHNLVKPLNESLESSITFYTKDAPLFLKGVIHQIFINKK